MPPIHALRRTRSASSALITHARIPASARQALGIGDTLCRLSVGVEDLADLRADLEFAPG